MAPIFICKIVVECALSLRSWCGLIVKQVAVRPLMERADRAAMQAPTSIGVQRKSDTHTDRCVEEMSHVEMWNVRCVFVVAVQVGPT